MKEIKTLQFVLQKLAKFWDAQNLAKIKLQHITAELNVIDADPQRNQLKLIQQMLSRVFDK